MKTLLTLCIFFVLGSQTIKASNDFINISKDQTDTAAILDKLNKEIIADSSNSTAYYNRGMFFQRQQKYKDALADFDKAIKIKVDYAEAYNERANAKFDGMIFNKEKSWAWDDYEKAIALNPKLAKAYFDRGTRKNNIQNMRLPTNGCADICKAYELGYPRQEGSYHGDCNCKK